MTRYPRHVLVSAAKIAGGICAPGKGSRGDFGFLLPGWKRPVHFDLVLVTSSARTKTDYISLLPAILTLAVYQPDATEQAAAGMLCQGLRRWSVKRAWWCIVADPVCSRTTLQALVLLLLEHWRQGELHTGYLSPS